MSLTLQHGRPENMTERLKKEQKVYELLDLLHIEYDRVDHEPAMHMDVCEEIAKVLKAATCKNLFLCNRQKTDFYLLLIPGEKIFKTKDLSAQIGSSRLSFGTADYMEEFLGLMNDTDHRVRLLVDSDVLKEEYLGCHPCINTSSLRLKTKDIFNTFLNAVDHNMTEVHL